MTSEITDEALSDRSARPTTVPSSSWDSVVRRAQFWRSPHDQPPWARPALLGIAAVMAVCSSWRAGAYLEGYYAAAVRSMSMSWHNFFFGAFDPTGTISLDKLPGAFWIQALFVRLFGLSTAAIVAPQIIEGVLCIFVLFRVVRRLSGAPAGLLAAGVLAVSPVNLALNRGNISDSLMILLVLLACDAAVSAVITGRWLSLVASGIWVGLAFQAKMIEAWVVLPALWLIIVVAGHGSWRRRFGGAAVLAVVALGVSLSWMSVVTLTPGGSRPYVDGSSTNSVFAQVFVYNGFGRVDQAAPNQLLRSTIGLDLPAPPPSGPDRLLTGSVGRDDGWLLPASAIALIGGLIATRRRQRHDLARVGFLLWGSWLVLLMITFSVSSSLNGYYVAALSPACAGLIAGGAALAWPRRHEPVVRGVAAATVAATAAYGAWLLSTSGDGVPAWLVPTLIVVSAGSILALRLSARRSAPRPIGVVGIVAALVSVLLVPMVASASVVVNRLGPFDTPFESHGATVGIRSFFAVGTSSAGLLPQLERARNGAPFLMATQTSVLAAPFIFTSGQEVLPIGGFTGTIPAPTLGALISLVRHGAFHLVIQSPTTRDPRLVWIARHCLPVAPVHTPGVQTHYALFYCLPSDAPAG